MKKRAQAAMEFLMTYGWAILAAVIVVGVLWYMIGNPANLAGNNYQMSAPLVANAMNIGASDLILEFRNGAGETITVTSVAFSGASCTANTTSTAVTSGSLGVFTLATCGWASGDRVNGDVTVSYTTSGSTVTQSATGSITGRVP